VTVITDTSVILNLCLLGQEGLLVPLFGTVLAPSQVVAEFQRLAVSDPRFRGLVFPAFIQQVAPSGTLPHLLQASRLHAGEVAALTLAVEHNADVILMDERAGRSAAQGLGLKCMGLLGILVEGRRRNLLPSIAPLLDRLQQQARFWMTKSLRDAVLRAAGETP
jgi:predicted nucleic acid-binding protein